MELSRWYRNRSVAQKVIGLVILPPLILGIVLAVGILQINKLGQALSNVVDHDIPLTQVISRVTAHQLMQAVSMERTLKWGSATRSSAGSQSQFEDAVQAFITHEQQVAEEFRRGQLILNRINSNTKLEQGRASFLEIQTLLREVEESHERYSTRSNDLIAFIRNRRPEQVRRMLESIDLAELELVGKLHTLSKMVEDFSQITATTAKRDEAETLALLVLLATLGITLSIAASFIMIRGDVTGSEERFRDLARSSADNFWEMDENLHYTWIQGGMFREQLRLNDEKLGKTRWEIAGIDPTDDPKWQAHDADLLARKPFRDFDYPVEMADGTRIWMRASGIPFFDAEQNFKGYRGVSTNITEMKRIDDERAHNHSKFQDFAAAAADRFWETDAEFNVTYVSPPKGILIRPEPEILGKKLWDLPPVPPGDPRIAEIRQSITNRTPIENLEIRTELPNGDFVHVEISANPYNDSCGEFAGFRGVTIDRTLERRALDRYRQLFEQSNDGIVFRSVDGQTIVECNEKFADQLGYAREDLVGEPIDKFAASPLKTGWYTRLANLVPGKTDIVEQLYRRKDGTEFAVEVKSSSIEIEGQRLVLSFIRDITEQKVTATHLQVSEEQRKSAQELMGLGYFERDLQTDQCTWSDIAYGIFGVDPTKSVSYSDFLSLIHPDDRPIVRADREKLPNTESLAQTEFRIIRPDGEERIIQNNAKTIRDYRGVVTKYIGTVRDVTREKKRDEQLRQAQKMEAVGQLTGGIAHDFNNILAGIQANLDLCHDFELSDEDRITSINQARSLVRVGADLTNQLLSFSRKQDLEPGPVQADQLVENLLAMMRRAFGANVTIETHFPADIWRIKADRNQLENAVLNLAINARDAMPEGGNISLSMSNLTVEAGDRHSDPDLVAGEYVALSVSDNGVGIPGSHLDKIFEPFFTTKDVGEGSGLGLSMVYGFAKQSNGSVAIQTGDGKGTCVTLYLPRSKEEKAKTTAEAQAPAHGHGERVMIIEDDEDIRCATSALLELLGYDVVDGGDGSDAAEIASRQEDHIDILLTDVVLPHGNFGPDLADEIAERNGPMKVLLMTGYVPDETTLAPPVDLRHPVIRKPVPVGQLGHKLQELLAADAA